MMWNWFSQLLGRNKASKRYKVRVDIPFEQHPFTIDAVNPVRHQVETAAPTSPSGDIPLAKAAQEVDVETQSS